MPNWINNQMEGNGNGSKPPRKRWEIEDKKSIKSKLINSHSELLSTKFNFPGLKLKLAEDGSPDIQYDLGRQLLEQNSGLFILKFQ